MFLRIQIRSNLTARRLRKRVADADRRRISQPSNDYDFSTVSGNRGYTTLYSVLLDL